MLQIHQLTKRYKDRPILSGLNLSLESRSISALIGPNGAGKSTLFSILAGAIQPDYGSILLQNCDITHLQMYLRARAGLGYLPQESSIIPSFTVFENVLAVVELYEQNKRLQHAIVTQLLEEFGILHLSRSVGAMLSGGERRRVEIARCIAIRPKFLLLDEPFAGVDPIAIGDFKNIVRYLVKKRGIGILITDHNFNDVADIAEQIYIMNDGNIIASGSEAEIVENPYVRSIYLGDSFNIRYS